MIKNCLFCEKEFGVDLNVVKKGHGKYCSYSCRNKYLWAQKEYRQHMSDAHKGQKMNEGLLKWVKSAEGRRMVSERMTGENHPKWISDRTKLSQNGNKRKSPAAIVWAIRVKKRDHYKCQISNAECAGHAEAHHILSWKDFPELRFEINNGITLCVFHHPRSRSKEKILAELFTSLVENK